MITEIMTFAEWSHKVDAELGRLIGFSIDCLPDQEWYEMFEMRISPLELATVIQVNLEGLVLDTITLSDIVW